MLNNSNIKAIKEQQGRAQRARHTDGGQTLNREFPVPCDPHTSSFHKKSSYRGIGNGVFTLYLLLA
jgi:hypothetical protein